MAYDSPGRKLTGKRAAADLSALQFRFVVQISPGFITQNTTVGGFVIGVLQNKPGNNDPAEVMVDGTSKVVAGAAVTEGTHVMSDGFGRAVPVVASATFPAVNYRVGVAQSTAAAAGEVISVELLHMGNV